MTRRMCTWRLRVAYHGAGFSGWQAQEGVRTVQQVLESALAKLAGAPVAAQAAGRTDAGVHAAGQVVSCQFTSTVPAHKMALALGAHLPDDVSVLAAEEMPAGFDARRHAVGKRYRYQILESPVRDPFDGGMSWQVHHGLDLEAMRCAAAVLVGEHDFESFRSVHCDARHARRYLWHVGVTRHGNRVSIEVRGNAFCRNQVRIMVGTLTEVGRGRRSPGDLAEVLNARDRRRAGVTAPPQGLSLAEVYYPDGLGHAQIPPDARFPGFPVTAAEWPPTADALRP